MQLNAEPSSSDEPVVMFKREFLYLTGVHPEAQRAWRLLGPFLQGLPSSAAIKGSDEAAISIPKSAATSTA
jgi:hypothetical protein